MNNKCTNCDLGWTNAWMNKRGQIEIKTCKENCIKNLKIIKK